MALSVLRNRREIEFARAAMRAQGVSALPSSWVCSLLECLKLKHFLQGDPLKSWDVWKTATFLKQTVDQDAEIVDLGAYKSEILPVLYRMGFTHLQGIDLNPAVLRQPHSEHIGYHVGDFYSSPLESETMSAVTAISAIEHGLDLGRLFKEVSRLLKSGGYFLCSTDYWPTKLATEDVGPFGLAWNIFSRPELIRVIDTAGEYGLTPVGPLDFDADVPLIRHLGRSYTFAWFSLIKS